MSVFDFVVFFIVIMGEGWGVRGWWWGLRLRRERYELGEGLCGGGWGLGGWEGGGRIGFNYCLVCWKWSGCWWCLI